MVTYKCKFDIKLNYRASMYEVEKTNTRSSKVIVDAKLRACWGLSLPELLLMQH